MAEKISSLIGVLERNEECRCIWVQGRGGRLSRGTRVDLKALENTQNELQSIIVECGKVEGKASLL